MSIRPNYAELNATKTPSAIDIAWAAGIYEGEGTCRLSGKKGKLGRGLSVSVPQKDPELLYRLRDWFGGSVNPPYGNINPCYKWDICGDRARVFLALCYPVLTACRRAQVDATSGLEFMGGRLTDGISMPDLRSLLEAFSQSRRVGRHQSNSNAVNRRRYYERHREEILLAKKQKRGATLTENVLQFDHEKVG